MGIKLADDLDIDGKSVSSRNSNRTYKGMTNYIPK